MIANYLRAISGTRAPLGEGRLLGITAGLNCGPANPTAKDAGAALERPQRTAIGWDGHLVAAHNNAKAIEASDLPVFCGHHLGAVLEADQAIEPLDLGEPLMAEATLVVVEPVNNDFLRGAVRVICGVHRRRRADLVHEPNGE